MEETFVKICPHCGSTEIHSNAEGFHVIANQSRCNGCGHRGIFPEIEQTKIEEFREHLKDEDTTKR